jgi:nucleoside-diphosphate-sugar epimerase
MGFKTGIKVPQKVIVTGASSFIGCHLAIKLSNDDYNVIATGSKRSDLYEGIQKDRIISLMKNDVQFETLDILNEESIKKFIHNYLPDIWFHLPAWTSDWGSYNFDLVKAFQLNVLPLEYIYKYLSESGCSGFIQVGSEAEYGDNNECKSETDSCYPLMPYGFSKLMQTIRIKQLSYQYNLCTRVSRVFTPFGQLENPNKIIPTVINHIKKNEMIELSNCEQKRDFIYIDDLINGFVTLLDDLNRDPLFDIFNICSGNATALKDVLLMIVSELESSRNLLKFGARPMRSGEDLVSYGNNKKAIEILGWKPGDLQNGINKYMLNP